MHHKSAPPPRKDRGPTPRPFPPYVTPAILYHARLEAVAADCLTPPGKLEGLCDIGNS
jgi:hypothetical protein